jgi:hypothetical protein
MAILNTIASSNRLLENLLWAFTLSKRGKDENRPKVKALRKQMTSIGRFSLVSQTEENPSIISFFVALAHEKNKDIDVDEFTRLWENRVLKRHDRFGFQVSGDNYRYFEVGIHLLATLFDSFHYYNHTLGHL